MAAIQRGPNGFVAAPVRTPSNPGKRLCPLDLSQWP
jgi:hypothetical protein